MAIQWVSTPPQAHRKIILILKPGESALATFLGEAQPVEIHWVDKRSQPCQGQDCKIDHQANAPRWRAYIPAQVRRFISRGNIGGEPLGDWSPKAEELIVELTEAHAEFIAIGKLRGLVVELHKPKGNVRQSLRVINTGQVCDDAPPAFDVKPILCRLWNVQEPKPIEPLRIHKTG